VGVDWDQIAKVDYDEGRPLEGTTRRARQALTRRRNHLRVTEGKVSPAGQTAPVNARKSIEKERFEACEEGRMGEEEVGKKTGEVKVKRHLGERIC